MVEVRLSRIYARLLEKQIQARFPVSPLSFELRKQAQIVTFSGCPHFITRRQIEGVLMGQTPAPAKNISVVRREGHIEIKVEPPSDLPRSVLDLKSYYEAERRRIVAQETEKPAKDRFHPAHVGAELKTLCLKVMKMATEIAQARAREKFGRIESKFAVLLLAGSARGPELDSDTDYMIVYQGGNKIYFNYLAEQLKEILYSCGIDGDNLISRFSKGRIAALQVDDFDSYYLIFRIAAGAVPVETFDDKETLELFFMKAAQACEYQKRLMRHLSWKDVFYAIEVRGKSTSWALVNPALEVRKIYTALGILRINNGLISSKIGTKELMEQIEGRGSLDSFRAEEILQAKQFFERLKNALWNLYRGVTPCFVQSDIPIVAQILGYKETKELAAQILEQKQVAGDFFAFACSRGKFSRNLQTVYTWWRKSKLLLRRLLRFVEYGNAEAVFLSKRPPADCP